MIVFIFSFLYLVTVIQANLLGNFTPEFFDINIDRNHPEKIYKAFEEFTIKYKRNYKDLAERKLRFNNFVKSFNKVDKLNSDAEKAGYDTSFGINKFSDWSSTEFSSALSHVPPPPPSVDDVPRLNITIYGKVNETRFKRKSTRYPDSFDLRDIKKNGRYIVGEVKSQGNCACCWGFAVTAVMETVNAVSTGKFTSLSDQEICDCGTEGTPGCSGGNLPMGIKYVRQYGLSSDNEYPFDENRAKKSRKCRVKSTTRIIPPEYNGGVIVIDDCYNAAEWHAGAIVGYGTTEDRRGRLHNYWIIKNSWDDDWGENGYVRIKRNVDWCAIEESPVTADMSSA
uniref:Uncharacterized protein n=1 Tax=Caenorhabditis japonica TaxID=281687 RepID=A0A8R1IAN9_CAEJA